MMLKRVAALCAVISVLLVLAFAAIKTYGDATYFLAYDPSLPLHAEVMESEAITGSVVLFGVELERAFRRTEFSFETRPGDRVPCVLTQPLVFDGRLPTVIFVHGAEQDRWFVETFCSSFNRAGFAMVSYDQWDFGERRVAGSVLQKAKAYYDRGRQSVYDTRRMVDYLHTRDDVDPERIYIVGASHGAVVSTHVLAHDKRFHAGVLTVGGGDAKVMLDAPIIREAVPGVLLALLKPLARWLAGPFDPVRSASDTVPTPVLVQNGLADIIVPPVAGLALFEALGEPKELRWYDIDHPGLRDGDGPEIIRMLDDARDWLAGHAGIPADDLPVRTETASLPSQ